MVLNKSQLSILKLLDLAGRIEGKTKLQKIIFLAETEEKVLLTYKFEKYNYGPFSFELSDDLNSLVTTGFIKEEKTIFGISDGKPMIKSNFELTVDGKTELKEKEDSIDNQTLESIKKVLEKWGSEPLDKILSYVYSKYMNGNNRDLAIRAK